VDRPDLVVVGRRVVTSDGCRPAAIHIAGGRISRVSAPDDVPADCAVDDAGTSIVLPGLVDSHVHVNEPGRTDWEGFDSATRAAAAGGVTTIVDMPLNSIPATTAVDALDAKRRAADNQCFVDLAFWGGIVPGNQVELEPLLAAGVRGFKCFLVPSGVDEFAAVSERDLRVAMPTLARLGATLLVHAELQGPIDAAAGRLETKRRRGDIDPCSYTVYLESRPKAAEDEAIALMIRLCAEYRVHTHIVHLSSADSVSALARARLDGVPLTVETCPHYLTFAAEDVPDGATSYKCAPPIREATNRDRLWDALGSGVIDAIVSDHSPAPPAMKRAESGDFLAAWGGIASLQIGLPAVWRIAGERGYPIDRVANWMSTAPARLAGLDAKGAIAEDFDADLAVFDPDHEWRVDPSALFHRHPLTPYAGGRMRGVVTRTYLRGRKIYERGAFIGAPTGKPITSPRASHRASG
jgi:allantoinase